MNIDNQKKAFLILINDNQRIILKICNAYCKNKAEREDLSQEIMYQLWKSADKYRPENKFTTWMYQVALNVAISFYRSRSTKPIIDYKENYPEVSTDEPATKNTEQNIVHLQKFIHDLKELDRAIMLLYLEEKSYKEIAEIVGISETNTATKISRIKNMGKQYFNAIKE